MGKLKFSIIVSLLFMCLLLYGCGSLKTGFRDLSNQEKSQVIKSYGAGRYLWFLIRGKDLRKFNSEEYKMYDQEYSIPVIEQFASRVMKENAMCDNDYELIKDSLMFYEGGSASIFIRCK